MGYKSNPIKALCWSKHKRSTSKFITSVKKISEQRNWEQVLLKHATEALADVKIDPPRASEGFSLALIGENAKVADGQSVYLVGNDYILLVSPSSFPETSFDEVEKANEMKNHLGSIAGQVILDPVAKGRAEGQSFFIVERCKPLSLRRFFGRIDRWMISGEALNFVRQMSVAAHPADDVARDNFSTSLEALCSINSLPADLRNAAKMKLMQLQTSEVTARHVPMHGDLWAGNLLRRKNGGLVVIDWGGSQVKGYGFFDLIRLSSSLGISKKRLIEESLWHIQTLSCNQVEAELHLLGALGHYGRSLGQFPIERFAEMAVYCWDILRSTLDSGAIKNAEN